MLIIIDARIPNDAIEKLQKYGEVFLLSSDNIVYDSISGHPDIFIHQMDELVIIAPNAPKELFEALKQSRIPFLKGKEKLGSKYPETSFYNAVSTKDFLIHRENHSTQCINKLNEKKKFIHVPQAYTRCNLLALPDASFITSDRGIEKALLEEGLEVYYFAPDDVILNGQDHGFLPGACGINKHQFFIVGSLNEYSDGERLKTILESKSLEIIELYEGRLIDGGGIFFLIP